MKAGWTRVALGDAFSSVQSGKNVKQDKTGAGTPVTRIETISSGVVDSARVGWTEEQVAASDRSWMKPGDLLFSHINSPDRVGQVALYEGSPPRLLHGINLLRLRPDPNVLDSRFALHLFRTPAFRIQVRQFVNQAVNQASISATNLKGISISIPALKEQRRIAAILDKADELRAKRRAAFEQLDSLTQATFLDMFGDPLGNPNAFDDTELGAVSEFVRGVTFKPADVAEPGAAGAIRCMRTTNVQSQLETDDVIWIPTEFVRRDAQMLLEGDTLISSANSWNLVGKACWVGDLDGAATFGGFVTVLRSASDRLDPWFLSCWFRSNRVQATVRSFGQRTTNISNLNLTRCRQLRIPLPPRAQQNEFRRRSRAVERQAASAQRSERELLALFASLQSRAFRGEL